ncbi:MAG: SWIM zinc finger family protein [Nitrospirae bacterium]|nr:SWIM zinc finger family protein [Nitrospirota bacterium]
MSWYGWRPYVPVAARRARALKKMEKLRAKGLHVRPVEIEGRKIARTFWGAAWCDHIESFSDYENRLPRGRTYVRNGSVCHLDIAKGEVSAMVSGSELYTVNVSIKTLARKKWKDVKDRCAGRIGSLIELLQGSLSKNVMTVVTDRNKGLFPLPGEIRLTCTCPDWAVMCKHVAAVLYGVGARLDEQPEALFLLRGVDHEELIGAEVGVATAVAHVGGGRRRIADEALADVFGIEMSDEAMPAVTKPSRRRKKTASKKAAGGAAERTLKRKAGTRKSAVIVKKTSASRRRLA